MTPPFPKLNPRTLGLASAAGGLLFLFGQFGALKDAAQRTSGGMLFLLTFSGALFLLLFARRGIRGILSQPLVLVPFGLALGFLQLFQWTLAHSPFPWLTEPWGRPNLGILSLEISAQLVVGILVLTLQAAWTWAMVVSIAQGRLDCLQRSWQQALQNFWRVFGALFLGHAVVMLGFSLLFPILGSMMAGFVPVGLALSFLWNLSSFFLVAFALEPGPWWPQMKRALAFGWRNKFHHGLPILAYMAVLGSFTRLSIRSTFRYHSSTEVHLDWIGGFPTDSHWWEDLADLEKASPSPVATLFLSFLWWVCAVAIKIQLCPDILSKPRPSPPPISKDAWQESAPSQDRHE
ncbi:MAG: hypothetical protein DWQ01_05670 [Planctomycetota bacterium]|nr:MAG: hypothetical protein DWQ01_05670 [Planctomycetota bacterium]